MHINLATSFASYFGVISDLYELSCSSSIIISPKSFTGANIAERAPYELLLSENDFTFQTDLGIRYSVSFNKEDIVLGGCDTYQIIIRKIEEIKSRYDPKVEATILAIIDEFFRSNLKVLLYMCDTSDGREESRNRLPDFVAF